MHNIRNSLFPYFLLNCCLQILHHQFYFNFIFISCFTPFLGREDGRRGREDGISFPLDLPDIELVWRLKSVLDFDRS